jgi:hypothetical protein
VTEEKPGEATTATTDGTEGTARRAEGLDGGDDRMRKRRRAGFSQMTTIPPPRPAGPLDAIEGPTANRA